MPETATPTGQTPAPADAASSPAPESFDALMGKYFPEEGAVQPATPDVQAPPQIEDKDTPAGESDPVDEDLDTEVEEDGGEVPGEESGEEDDPDEPQLEETEEDEDPELDALLASSEDDDASGDEPDTSKETFLPEFDRKKLLKDHPELEAPYKHMQAAFSKRMAETAKLAKKGEEATQRAQEIEAQAKAFQEHLQNDDTFEEFLVRVSLSRPEVMERAYERAISLNEDEGKKKEYLQSQELTETKALLKEREERDAVAARQKRVTEVINLTQRLATRLGLTTESDLEVAEQYVANQIRTNAANGGKPDITPEQIVSAVKRAAKALSKGKDSVRKAVKQEVRKDGLKAAQDRVRNPQRRPAPPRSGAGPARSTQTNTRISNAPKQEPLASWIDEQLGVEA